MRVLATVGPVCLSLLSGCDFLEPKTTFAIASADRPVKSATLKFCRRVYPMIDVDGRWEVAVKVLEEDCDNSVSVLMSDGRSMVCEIGYVTGGGFPRKVLFHIKDTSCRTQEIYGDTGNQSGS